MILIVFFFQVNLNDVLNTRYSDASLPRNCFHQAPHQGQIQENRKEGVQMHESVPSRTCPPPPGNFLHFLFSEVAFSAFSGKNSAQNLINYIKILTAIINSYQSRSNSNDPLNILHECSDTNLLMISFNYMSKKRGVRTPPPLPPGSAPATWMSPSMVRFTHTHLST